MLQLHDKTLLFLQGDGSFTRHRQPFMRGWPIRSLTGQIFAHTSDHREPVGRYTWVLALTEAGTSRIIGSIARATFTFSRGRRK